MTTPTDLPDGYYQVAPGKLVNAVTWLEMRSKPASPVAPALRLVAATDQDRATCRSLWTQIGTPWLWSRADASLDPPISNTFLGLDDAGRTVGIVEVSSQTAKDIEITFFGLIPAAVGRGLGRRMMAAALDRVWRSADRVWLHTCNFDHPGALAFYQACGFVPFASGFEIMDDPRRDGSLPADAAPHVPLIVPPRP